MKNIEIIRDAGLCISCGVCAANCPKDCITYEFSPEGMLCPKVGAGDCVKCGRCLEVCPSSEFETDIDPDQISSYVMGSYHLILKAKCRNRDILKNSTSGGVVTELIMCLLTSGEYHAAFTVLGYDYHKTLETVKIEKVDDLKLSFGSRYLPVSHTEAVKYICKNQDKRVIIVATSCAMDAILKSIRLNHLKRENYLLIGLFCDKTMNYRAMHYFDNIPEVKGNIKEFYFRSKVGSKWPGGVRIVLENNETILLPSSIRKNIKDYYAPERCLYCLDKLNKSADISVGDNYIKKNADEEGISSVIIRTHKGQIAWDNFSPFFEWSQDTEQDLLVSQLIENKRDNFAFGCLKGVYHYKRRIPCAIRMKYFELMRKRKLGNSDNTYQAVSRDIMSRQLISKIKRRILKL